MARQDIGYDYEDFGMTAEELQAKYSDAGHPEFTPEIYEQRDASDALMSYWDWVVEGIEGDDNEIEGEPLPEATSPDASPLVVLNSVDLFAAHLVAWHTRKVAMLQHMLKVPEGTEFTIKIDQEDEKTVTLSGDVLTAFRGGLATALTELGELPFKAIAADEAPQPEAKDQAANG